MRVLLLQQAVGRPQRPRYQTCAPSEKPKDSTASGKGGELLFLRGVHFQMSVICKSRKVCDSGGMESVMKSGGKQQDEDIDDEDVAHTGTLVHPSTTSLVVLNMLGCGYAQPSYTVQGMQIIVSFPSSANEENEDGVVVDQGDTKRPLSAETA